MKKSKFLNIALSFSFLLSGSAFLGGCGHTHELTKVDETLATCTTAGNTAYYTCECGKYFSDEKGETEVEKDSWIVEATGHDLRIVDGVAPTCTADGFKTYWDCLNCDKYFQDEDAKNEISEGAWVLEATDHNYAATEWYDAAHKYVKTLVCENNTQHKIDNIPVAVNVDTIDTVLNEEAKAGKNLSSYNLKLASGNYGKLTLESANRTNVGTGVVDNPYIYNREIASLVIAGENKETTIIDGFSFDMNRKVVYKGPNGTGGVDYYKDSQCVIDTVLFKDVTFTDKLYLNSLVSEYNETSRVRINNFVFENVVFDFDGKDVDNSAIHIISEQGGIGNVVVNGCTFKNLAPVKGIQIDVRSSDDINITVTNNTFNDLGHNAVQLSGSGSEFTGEIVIANNTVTNTTDRAFRISKIGEDGELSFVNNTMVNASDGDGELLKATIVDGATITISGNFWGSIDGTTPLKGLKNETAGGENIMDSNPAN